MESGLRGIVRANLPPRAGKSCTPARGTGLEPVSDFVRVVCKKSGEGPDSVDGQTAQRFECLNFCQFYERLSRFVNLCQRKRRPAPPVGLRIQESFKRCDEGKRGPERVSTQSIIPCRSHHTAVGK